MAKNFVEEGKTVAIVASAAISSGDLVQVGDVFAVALTAVSGWSAQPGRRKPHTASHNWRWGTTG